MSYDLFCIYNYQENVILFQCILKVYKDRKMSMSKTKKLTKTKNALKSGKNLKNKRNYQGQYLLD